ncbi:DnaJ domain-containing protein [Synechocystis sp. LKSZ1]|uniref:J domain-containing protein n=1 Tax=Synechocystis sp. LKSZ1 TaxID=3144951 RepID=UPI00336C22C7
MISFPIKQGLFKYDVMDHHAILGTPLDATSQQIRQSYLKIAHILHPDTCKTEDESQKKLAEKLFSKLVNPAYEILSRENSRTEHLLIASQTARNLTQERTSLVQASPDTQKLWAAKNNPELVYRQLLNPLIRDLYGDLEQVFSKIAHLSDLNLVFLLLKAETPAKVIAQSQRTIVQSERTASSSAPIPEPPKAEPVKLSPQETYLRRAQDYYEKGQYNAAIGELREILKLDPKHSQAHCLLGMAYLKNSMLTMAKVHIKTAVELDPQNPQIMMAKRELDKQTLSDTQKSASKDSKGGFLGGLFGNKKK